MGLWLVIPVRQHFKEGTKFHCYKKAPHLIDMVTALWLKTTCEKHDLEAVWKELSDELAGYKLIPQYV